MQDAVDVACVSHVPRDSVGFVVGLRSELLTDLTQSGAQDARDARLCVRLRVHTLVRCAVELYVSAYVAPDGSISSEDGERPRTRFLVEPDGGQGTKLTQPASEAYDWMSYAMRRARGECDAIVALVVLVRPERLSGAGAETLADRLGDAPDAAAAAVCDAPSDADGGASAPPCTEVTGERLCFDLRPASGGVLTLVNVLHELIMADGSVYTLRDMYGIEGSEFAAGMAGGGAHALETPVPGVPVTAASDTAAPARDAFAAPTDSAADDMECIVCMAEPRAVLVMPCRHFCLCRSCAAELRRQLQPCPICRTGVDSLVLLPSRTAEQAHNAMLTAGTTSPPAAQSPPPLPRLVSSASAAPLLAGDDLV